MAPSLGLILAGLTAGCGEPGGAQVPLLARPEVGKFALTVQGTGRVIPLEQSIVACPSNMWAKVAESAEPGTQVTTGETVVVLDMNDYESELKARKRGHANNLLKLERLSARQAQARADRERELTEKRLALASSQDKLGILLAGPPVARVRAQQLMVQAGDAKASERNRLLESEEKLRARGFTSELNYLDAAGELEKAQRRLQSAQADLRRLKAGPRAPDRKRLQAEEVLYSLETDQMAQKQAGDIEVQKLEYKETELGVSSVARRVRRVEKRIRKGNIKATTSGVVLHSFQGELGRRIPPGEFVWSAMQLMRVVRMDRFMIEVRISEREVDLIDLGASATVIFPALPEAELTAKVSKIGKFAVPRDPSDSEGVKVFEVELSFEDLPEGIRPDLTAKVEIHRAKVAAGWRVGAEAVHRTGEQASVFLPGRREVPVEVLAEDGEFCYLSGEPPGDAILLASEAQE